VGDGRVSKKKKVKWRRGSVVDILQRGKSDGKYVEK
jgi:hypothetical protein